MFLDCGRKQANPQKTQKIHKKNIKNSTQKGIYSLWGERANQYTTVQPWNKQ